MPYKDLRDWIAKLEKTEGLKRVKAEVDWNLELGAIARRVSNEEGPALLFENIKDYHDTACRKLFLNALGSRERVAVALGLPKNTGWRGITEFIKKRLGRLLDPIKVASGPVKQNIVKGDKVNLYEFPVPKYNELDGGRYINSRGMVVTMDPDTKIMNVGIYRGMIGDSEKSIPVLLVPYQHWGRHFLKYKERGEEMPVAVVYGWEPILLCVAGTPVSHPEYELAGGLRGEPVELVKCETSDLYVPASAEIVLEGYISPDPKTFQMEGPFGEYPGFYGGIRQPRPTICVECITHRDNPIFRGGICGNGPGKLIEDNYWATPFMTAAIWKALEEAGATNVLGVWATPVAYATNLLIQIDKTHKDHAKQIAAIFLGISHLAHQTGKNIIIVDKDIDIYDDRAVDWALAWRTNANMGAIQFIPGTVGALLDPSIPLPQTGGLKLWTRVLIDATINWDLEPEEKYGGERQPPVCYEISPKINKLITRRWREYGF